MSDAIVHKSGVTDFQIDPNSIRKQVSLEINAITKFLLLRMKYVIEGGYWISVSSVRPPIRLSGSFLGIGSLVFSETLYGVRGPYEDVRDRAWFFFGKNSSGKYGQK